MDDLALVDTTAHVRKNWECTPNIQSAHVVSKPREESCTIGG